jgi:hypothetical protein
MPPLPQPFEPHISVANDFSKTPGPRYESEGPYSGELFRRKHLLPLVAEAVRENKKLTVDLDGTAGYGTSFLEEAFGGLVREDGYSASELGRLLALISEEESYLADDIHEYIAEAEQLSRDRR